MLFTNPPLLEGPHMLPDLVGWWDFSDENEMVFSGNNITSLDDKAPGGQLMQFDGSRPYHSQPVNAINGRPSGGFAVGINQTMRTSADNAQHAMGTSEFTMVVVFRSTDVNRGALLGRNDTGTPFYHMRVNNADTNNGDLVATCKDQSVVTAVVASDDEEFNDDSAYIVAMLRDSSKYLRAYNNNSELTQSPDTTTTGNIDETSGTIYVWIGSNHGSDQFFVGQIGEVLIFDDELTSDEMEYLHRYLRKKWGV